MTQLKFLILFIFFAFGLSSCSVHYGGNIVGYEPITATKKIVKRVNEKSTPAVYFLGLGGLSKAGLLSEAKTILFNNVKLEDGQTLNNISFEYKASNFIIFQTNRVFISADIMQEVNEIETKTHLPDNTTSLDQQQIVEYLGFKIGEKTYYKRQLFGATRTGTIVKFYGKKVEVVDASDGDIFTVNFNLLRKHTDNQLD